MGEIQVKGNYTEEIRRNVAPQVYRLRDFILEGKRVTCDVARLSLGIGGSSLPRRILDCKVFLEMDKIKARWKPYTTTWGIKTRIREYYMLEEDIENYKINCMGIMIKYPKRDKSIKRNQHAETL